MTDETTRVVTTNAVQEAADSATGQEKGLTDGRLSPGSDKAGDEPKGESQKTFDESYVKALRSEAAGYRVKLKEFEAAEEARKLTELSEAERLTLRAETAERRIREMEVQNLRARAAAHHRLPEELYEFITAEDEEGAQAQAEKLAARLKPKVDLPPAGGRNPANGVEGAERQGEQKRLDAMRGRVPALNGRILLG